MTITEFLAEGFAVRTQAHFAHLQTTSYAQHVALGEFYDKLTGLLDDFAEQWMGLNEARVGKFPSISLDGSPEPYELLAEYLHLLDTGGDKVCDDDPTLLNTLADIRELTMHTLYKLKNLK